MDKTATYDPEVNAIYVTLKDGRIKRTREVSAVVMADYDEDGNVLGVEVLMPS